MHYCLCLGPFLCFLSVFDQFLFSRSALLVVSQTKGWGWPAAQDVISCQEIEAFLFYICIVYSLTMLGHYLKLTPSLSATITTSYSIYFSVKLSHPTWNQTPPGLMYRIPIPCNIYFIKGLRFQSESTLLQHDTSDFSRIKQIHQQQKCCSTTFYKFKQAHLCQSCCAAILRC